MKKILFYISLFFATTLNAQHLFTYTVSTEIDYSSIDVKQVEAMMKKVEKELHNFEFELYIENQEAYFSIKQRLKPGCTPQNIWSIANALVYSDEKWYYNHENNIQLSQRDFMGEYFLIDTSHKEHNWQLIKESKVVNGYKAYKATSTRKFIGSNGVKEEEVVAWYCPDLAYSYGPFEFGGLPGLVVELHMQTVTYRLTKYKREKKNIKKPERGKHISEHDFFEKADTAVKRF